MASEVQENKGSVSELCRKRHFFDLKGDSSFWNYIPLAFLCLWKMPSFLRWKEQILFLFK